MPSLAGLETVAEACRRHHIPRRTMLAAIARGDLKAKKLPGVTGPYLLKPAAVDAYAVKRSGEDDATGGEVAAS